MQIDFLFGKDDIKGRSDNELNLAAVRKRGGGTLIDLRTKLTLPCLLYFK